MNKLEHAKENYKRARAILGGAQTTKFKAERAWSEANRATQLAMVEAGTWKGYGANDDVRETRLRTEAHPGEWQAYQQAILGLIEAEAQNDLARIDFEAAIAQSKEN